MVVRIVLIIVAVALALYLLYLLRRPIGWLLIAIFLAVALSGPVNLLQRHMSAGFAIVLVYLGLLLIPFALGALMLPPIVNGADDLAHNAPVYAHDVAEFVRDDPRLRKLDQDYDITQKLEEQAEELPARLGDAATILGDVGFGIVNSIFAVVTILILTAFMLGGGRRWIEPACATCPRSARSGRARAAARPSGGQLRGRRAVPGADRRDPRLHRAADPRRPVRGAAGGDSSSWT